MKLIFKVKPAGQNGKSPVEIILGKDRLLAKDTNQLLSTLDKLLKKNKIEVSARTPLGSYGTPEGEDIKDIKLELDEKAGLTSQRIIKTVIKALSLKL